MSDQPPSSPSGGTPQNPFQGLDVDKIKTAGLPTQLMLGSSVVFFIFAFFDWFSVDYAGFSSGSNAFDNFRGTLAWLLMIGLAVVALLMLLKGANQNFVYASVGCAGLATLLTLWYWAWIPSGAGYGGAFGLYICLIAAIAGTVGAVMNMQAFMKKGA